MPWWKRKLSRSAGTLATGKKTWHTQYENHSQVLRSVYVSGISRFMLVMFFWLEYTIYIYICLCCWIVDSYQGMIPTVVFLQRHATSASAPGPPIETSKRLRRRCKSYKRSWGPCGCSAQCLMQPVYSVQVAHLDPWLPKHPWRCGCQTVKQPPNLPILVTKSFSPPRERHCKFNGPRILFQEYTELPFLGR